MYSTHTIEFKKLLQLTKLQQASTIQNNNDCEWDPMILTSYIICTSIFKFFL